MDIKAYAKINLSLDILNKRDDGYHLLDTVMQSVDLYDIISLSKNKNCKINISSNIFGLPTDKKNTAYKAARLIMDYYKITDMGVNIHIHKNIPSQAGMGGGSADAAAVISGMFKLFDLEADEKIQLEIATKVGADVPFCLIGGTKRCEGIGEIISSVPKLCDCNILICKPSVGVSTPKAFEICDKFPQQKSHFSTAGLIKALETGDLSEICDNFGNRFDDLLQIPEVQIIKSIMKVNGALNALMTGSGSAVFGIFDSIEKALMAKEALKNHGELFCVKPL